MLWTAPNILSLVRIFGSFALIALAMLDQPFWFVGLYLILGFTDLIDGPLARQFGQGSELGAVLDSLADVLLTSCLIVGSSVLCWGEIRNELLLIAIVIVSYLCAIGASLWKFRRFPAYHTCAAKLTHFLAAVAGVSLVLGWSVWPLRIAAAGALVANLESVLISVRLAGWRSNVPSIFSAGPLSLPAGVRLSRSDKLQNDQ